MKSNAGILQWQQKYNCYYIALQLKRFMLACDIHITGNEKADALAKSATTINDRQSSFRVVPNTDVTGIIKGAI